MITWGGADHGPLPRGDAAMGHRGGMEARQVAPPEAIRALDSLAGPDFLYACELTAAPGDDRSAEAWARAVFEGAPRPVRWFVVMGWIVGLGLRLGPRRSPDHVLGWKILAATPSTVVLGVRSGVLSAHLVVRVRDAHVVHATFVRYARRPGRALWAAAAPIHGRVIPYLLRHAATNSSKAHFGPASHRGSRRRARRSARDPRSARWS